MLHSRIERIESLLQTEIGAIIDCDLENPNLPQFITVSKVKVSKDLSLALVLITFLQDQTPEVIRQTVKELNKAGGYVTYLLTQRMHLKRHPKVKFAYSDALKHAMDIEKLFHQISREHAEQAAREAESGGAGSEE